MSLYEIHKLLWDVRRVRAVTERYRAEPDAVLDDYDIAGQFRGWMKDLDFKALYEHGVNPYLLYFCAIQLEVDRADYYARIRGVKTP
ncbi:hypothetical protein VSH64_07430 [Amycolatopsis rhabdoformis]|uniref:Extradiol ring-cleavage dioxygenase LigAB LigA subunit domain-containing protein n=1 Tax=Amycolatopsis rhabdoformis TaxID=1448059 RepID=A0ABZ1IBZ0_9PSEU|nr:hypothetical protein [Amycolatopsis rhabdoformis]WSE31940.1 hypothetical protein VSH64_07430 [Amycolatopsis rhabdoformis]